jgi:hypothetical protein
MYYTFGESLSVERIRNEALSYYFPHGQCGGLRLFISLSIRTSNWQLYWCRPKYMHFHRVFLELTVCMRHSAIHTWDKKRSKENKSFMIKGVPVLKGDRTINIK